MLAMTARKWFFIISIWAIGEIEDSSPSYITNSCYHIVATIAFFFSVFFFYVDHIETSL